MADKADNVEKSADKAEKSADKAEKSTVEAENSILNFQPGWSASEASVISPRVCASTSVWSVNLLLQFV
jgi:hypothetical protein